ncbi:hypothetical protein [Nonomuraea terrae]|uniref:hypothetical protein n=1 Tax=Nonomuraea terrae TaxID=2530383 RepID=UPI00165273FC|nr:hypothetical protein [Nonomuraea terrae]
MDVQERLQIRERVARADGFHIEGRQVDPVTPGQLDDVFASARISVPASIIGALIAEWLATGKGIGAEILRAIGGFRYDEV